MPRHAKTRLALTLSAMLACTRFANGQSTTPPAPPEIAALIDQLSNPATAKSASDRLIALGDAARPALLAAAKSQPAVRKTLGLIDSAAAVAPTLITLKLDKAPVENILAAIGKQAGITMRPYNRGMWNGRANRAPISVDYHAVPLWDVIQDLSDKAQIIPYLNAGGTHDLTFMPSGMMGPPVLTCPKSPAGAVVMLLSGLSYSRTVDLGRPTSREPNFNGDLTMIVEPKLRILNWSSPATLTEAMDNHGNSLLEGNTGGGTSSGGNQLQLSTQLRLKYPDKNPGDSIKRLRGYVSLRVVTQVESIKIDDLANITNKNIKLPSGREVTIESLTHTAADNNRQYSVKMTFTDTKDVQNVWELFNGSPPRLIDAAGRDLQYQNVQNESTTGKTVHASIEYFRPTLDDGVEAGEPAKFSWDLPTQSQLVQVPFEFHDIAMP